MLVPKSQLLEYLTPEDKERVKKELLKLRMKDMRKGEREGALFKTIDKPFVAGKAGGVTRQGGGTSRGDR